MNARAERVGTVKAELGECPVWEASSGLLRWIEPLAGRIHSTSPSSGMTTTVTVLAPIGSIALRSSGGFVVAALDGFALLAGDPARYNMLARISAWDTRTRMNDGKCDPAGRFWAGSLSLDAMSPLGALYRLAADHGVEKMLGGITTSNGLAWSPDGRTVYHADSAPRTISAFDFDVEDGRIRGKRAFVRLGPSEGRPDGLTVDADGCLWAAIWGGGSVRRYTPGGRLDREIRFPVRNITSCVFGGADLADLFVTTAAEREKDPHDDAQLGGALFVCRPGVTGLRAAAYAG